jgi:DNA-binding transcriptional MerR regulator
MISGFTRQEALSITGITSGRLGYLDKTGLVTPEKFGNPKKPQVVYSVGQIIELKVISRLREKLSLQEIRKVVEYLKSKNYEQSLFECNLIFVDDELYLIEDWKEFGMKVLKASGRNKGQIAIHEIGKIGEVISELKREAEKHRVLDYEKRVQGTPLAIASK